MRADAVAFVSAGRRTSRKGEPASRSSAETLSDPPQRGPGFVAAWFRRYWLAVWFAAVTAARLSLVDFSQEDFFFLDGTLYLEATRVWLAGGDPFMVEIHQLILAAPPPTLLPLVPLAVLPPSLGLAILILSLAASAVLTVRLLRLPWWWLAFPPLVECVITGNVHGLLLPLMLTGRGWLAIILKMYAAIPLAMLGQWRQLFLAALAILVTIPILPWGPYISRYADISATYAETSRAGLPLDVLVAFAPIALVSFLVIGRERAAWMAVPALWPSPQPYYLTLAMPTRSAAAMAVVAAPIPQSGLFALFLLAVLHAARWYQARHLTPRLVT
jgi:hypothetical protein